MNRRTLGAVLLALCAALVLGVVVGQIFLKPQKHQVVIPHIGQIQVLNACGVSGAAATVSNFLRAQGFDVVEYGNYDEWFFDHTIVACRNQNMKLTKQVAQALQTERVLLLRKEGTLLDATVFVGKDFKNLIKES